MVKQAQKKEEQFLAEAKHTATTATAGFATVITLGGMNSSKTAVNVLSVFANGNMNGQFGQYDRAMKFKKAAKRFQAGEFPLFPPG